MLNPWNVNSADNVIFCALITCNLYSIASSLAPPRTPTTTLLLSAENNYFMRKQTVELRHNISYKIACAPSEDSDQPAQADQSLRCPLEDASVPWLPTEYSAKTDHADQTGCAGWPESLLGAHAILQEIPCPGWYWSYTTRNDSIRTCG